MATQTGNAAPRVTGTALQDTTRADEKTQGEHTISATIGGSPINRRLSSTPSSLVIYSAEGVSIPLLSQDGSVRAYTLVDPDDAERVMANVWRLRTIGRLKYAVRFTRHRTDMTVVALHRELIEPPADRCVDHRNGDGLDNRKANLRVATNEQNAANSRVYATNTTGYRGVYRRAPYDKYRAEIVSRGRSRKLGYFDTAIEAARAYNAAALDVFGEFARLNEGVD